MVLFCFNDKELENFWQAGQALPEAMVDARVVHAKPPASESAWFDLIKRVRPSVIVGAWSLPAIPDELWQVVPEFRYLCYLCGSIRYKISRRFIEQGGLVTNWGDLGVRTVAECALMLTLCCLRRTTRYAFEMHIERAWNGFGSPPPKSLFGRKVGIHGFGAVARALVSLLQPFGCEIRFWSNGVAASTIESYGLNAAESLERIFSDSDVVIEAEALTPETRHYVTSAHLLSMQPDSVFINVGRGPVLAPGAIEALAARLDVAIGLDVYDVEPLPADSPLRGYDHVTLLPHTAGPTLDQYDAIRQFSLANIDAYFHGKTISSVIQPDQFERMT